MRSGSAIGHTITGMLVLLCGATPILAARYHRAPFSAFNAGASATIGMRYGYNPSAPRECDSSRPTPVFSGTLVTPEPGGASGDVAFDKLGDPWESVLKDGEWLCASRVTVPKLATGRWHFTHSFQQSPTPGCDRVVPLPMNDSNGHLYVLWMAGLDGRCRH